MKKSIDFIAFATVLLILSAATTPALCLNRPDDRLGAATAGMATTNSVQALTCQNEVEEIPTASAAFLPEVESSIGAYPQVFSSSTVIGYQLPQAAQVNLKVFDTEDRVIVTLVDGWNQPGWHLVNFDGSNLTAGFYHYTLTAEDQIFTGRMVLIK